MQYASPELRFLPLATGHKLHAALLRLRGQEQEVVELLAVVAVFTTFGESLIRGTLPTDYRPPTTHCPSSSRLFLAKEFGLLDYDVGCSLLLVGRSLPRAVEPPENVAIQDATP